MTPRVYNRWPSIPGTSRARNTALGTARSASYEMAPKRAPQQQQQLPPHLSHKCALALIPPRAIQGPIESLRKTHDKQFQRWPAHINLIYPFLADPSSAPSPTCDATSAKQLRPEIHARLQRAVQELRPFTIRLSASPAGTFRHGKKSSTVWLRPRDPDGGGVKSVAADSEPAKSQALLQLHDSLQKEFDECSTDTRPFTPHLSVGQASSAQAAEAIVAAAREGVDDFLAAQRISKAAGEPLVDDDRDQEQATGLEWLVDRVYVIEREGYHGRFEVVGEIVLDPASTETAPEDLHDDGEEQVVDGFVVVRGPQRGTAAERSTA